MTPAILEKISSYTTDSDVINFFSSLLVGGVNSRDGFTKKRECVALIRKVDSNLADFVTDGAGKGAELDIFDRGDQDCVGMTPLMWACLFNWAQVAMKLIEQKSKPCEVSMLANYSYTALMIAAWRADFSLVDLVAKSDLELIDAVSGAKETALCVAVSHGNMAAIRCLTQNKASVEIGKSILTKAIEGNNQEIVSILAQKISQINQAPRMGKTYLHTACRLGNPEIIEILCENGADVTRICNKSHTCALMEAARHGHASAVRVLIQRKAFVNMTVEGGESEEAGFTALHFAAKENCGEVVGILLQSDADRNARSKWGEKPITIAIRRKNQEIVKMLLCGECEPEFMVEAVRSKEEGSVAALLDNLGCSQRIKDQGLVEAALNGCDDIATRLLSSGADPNAVGQNGENSPALLATRNGHLGVFRTVVEAGGSVTAKDDNGCSALHYLIACDPSQALLDWLIEEKRVCNVDAFLQKDNLGYSTFQYASSDHTFRRLLHLYDPKPWMRKQDVTHKRNAAAQVNQDNTRLTSNTLMQAGLKFPKVGMEMMDRAIQPVGYGPYDKDLEVHFDFNMLFSNKIERFDILETLLDKQSTLLEHPLIKQFLQKKYDRFPRAFYIFQVSCYFLLALFFTVGAALQKSNVSQHLAASDIFPCLALTILAFCVAVEIGQMAKQRLGYLMQFVNLFQIFIYILTLAVTILMFPFFKHSHPSIFNQNVVKGFASLTIVLLCLNFLLSMRRSEIFGIYITIFCNVLRSMSRMLIPIAVLLTSFSAAFFCIFRFEPATASSDNQDQDASYRNMWITGFKLLSLLIGSVDPDEQTVDRDEIPLFVSQSILIVIFIIFMTIITINLLIGITIGNIEDEIKRAEWTKLLLLTEFVVQAESLANTVGLKKRLCFNESTLILYPNREKHANCCVELAKNLKSAVMASSQSSEKKQLKTDVALLVQNTFETSKV